LDAAPKEKYDNNAPVAAAYKWRAAALGTYRHNQLQGIEARKQTRKRSNGTPIPSNSATASIVIIATKNLLSPPPLAAAAGSFGIRCTRLSLFRIVSNLSLWFSVCLSGRLRQANKDFSSTSGRISASMNPLGKEIRAVAVSLQECLKFLSLVLCLSVCLSVCLVVFVKRTKTSLSPVDESQLR